MKSTTFLFALVALLVSITFASALTLTIPSTDLTSGNAITVTLKSEEAYDQTVTLNATTVTDGVNSFNVGITPASFSLAPLATQQVVVSAPTLTTDFRFGNYQTTLTATAKNSTDAIITRSSTIRFSKSFCRAGSVGNNLSLNIDWSSDGDDDDEWMPLDTITVDVDVENDGDTDIDDVFVELAFLDSSGKNVANELDFENDDEEKIDLGDLDDGDEDTASFAFQLPGDFDSGNYKLAVKAYSKKSGENVVCTDQSTDFDSVTYEDIDVNREDDEGKFIAFDDIRLSPESVTCGDTVTLTANVFNIGDNDEDRVLVKLANTELKVSSTQEIRQGLDMGDDQTVSFSFTVPENAVDKTYQLELSSEYDYKNGLYREQSEEDQRVPLKVFGCTLANGDDESESIATITAALGSQARAGEELVVTSTIRNAGSQTATFVINAKGYESWSDLNSISDRIITLRAGESKQVTFTFNVQDDAVGEKSFNIEATNGDRTQTQQVAVELAAGQQSLGGFSDSKVIWIIGIVNVLLIIVIIVVAVRIAQR